MDKKYRIAILDGQTVQAMAMSEVFYKNGHQIVLLCDKKTSYGYYTKYAQKKVLCPKITDSKEEYLNFIIPFLEKNPVDVIIPSNDDSASFMSKYKKELSNHVKLLMPDYDIFIRAYDKNSLMDLCKENSYPHPLTADMEKYSLEEAVKYVGFPAILKPNLTSGGRGMTIVNSLEELEQVYSNTVKTYGACHLQQYIPFGGRQFKVQIFKQKGKADSPYTIMQKIRFYPEKGGSSSCNMTVDNKSLYLLCNQILSDLQWEGFADFDLIEDLRDREIKIMEINPRVPACIKTAFKSGVDFASMILNGSVEKEIPSHDYQPGKYLRYFGLEMLWFYYSKNRFKTKPSWFKFFGKNIFYQDGSIADPMPFIIGTLGGFVKQLNPKFRKAKSGMR
jgi:predicted ATP-grasp superfamily ATP-dependent carboligase